MAPTPTVIITGPTAVGKTDLSLALARHFRVPVISADSRQCYKYLDIGTDKVPQSIRDEIPHYHISTLLPDQSHSAADFAKDTKIWSREILTDSPLVLIAGGSTLYIESLIRPFDSVPPKNAGNIHKLEIMAREKGLESIQAKLQEVDPHYAKRMDGLNPHRMFRALDVWMQTGKPFSSFHKNRPLTVPEHMLLVCLDRDRTELHERIDHRVDRMLDDGLVEETESILAMGYSPGLQSLQTVGYRETIARIKGDLSAGEMRDQIKTRTRHYARRQLTWFRRWNNVQRINRSAQSEKIILSELLPLTEQLAADSQRRYL